MYFCGTIKQTRLREFCVYRGSCKKYSVLQVRLSFFYRQSAPVFLFSEWNEEENYEFAQSCGVPS